jgi:sterol desaturase/sphingolipid hydroxylase (fatty acid hydroxylase superfamily)
MEDPMRATPESPRMFDNDLLDALSRTPWWTVPLLWVPGVTAFFLYGLLVHDLPLAASIGTALAGWFAWTFVEYGLHRTVFHWRPQTTWGPRLHFILHGVHHDWHQDPYRLVMPPSVSLLLCVLFGAAFHALLGPAWFWPYYAGFVGGYLVYDVTHYALHHRKLKHPVFLKLKKHHLLHHHSPSHSARKYGVSTTLWDHVFGTY